MAIQLQVLLDIFGILHRVIAFVKDEGTYFCAMATTLHSIIDCEPLKIFRVHEGTCFGHVMSKAHEYATNGWTKKCQCEKTSKWFTKNHYTLLEIMPFATSHYAIGMQLAIICNNKFGIV
jgi:hypothetical protein